VSEVLERAEENFLKRKRLKRDGWNMEQLLKRVCELTNIRAEDIRQKGRGNARSHARGLIAYWGYHELGMAGPEISQFLGISRPALSKAIQRGEGHARGTGVKLIS